MKEKLMICGGCNAKIGPGDLNKILTKIPQTTSERLLVGFDTSDDAAVLKMTDDLAIIQTLDFFPTMVSDPYLYGKIAATNALSDVYAMGGEVLSAMNIVCFPENYDLEMLGEILKGGAEKVKEAGGVLVGGHSIHDSTPKYGLSVTGLIHPDKILKNNNCQLNDNLILTKPIGSGIITTAYSVGEASEKAFLEATEAMQTLNKYAAEVIVDYDVNSCTDVTGFGLAGHLLEMLAGAYSANIYFDKIPYIMEAYECAKECLVTAGGQRNRNQFSNQVENITQEFAVEELIYDPQTSGGLLLSVTEKETDELLLALLDAGVSASLIGKVIEKNKVGITIYN
ncbi:selenide, water dikinase SelD [Vagococcus intermedius]|uniref:Selenide, water dikinase n=1 Tax=Vagococcus intermedius TaxID=2991418 RepID=A0AAF0CWA3_9ENTE|nr:selenide, water dikinase SelD [Vagococcus intermedius]WEG74200.1 selenide, water dikinase SelD [Vagococcus intermedius]WEG76281.1 selenide, water dikinase SelD [Vagococcus intermedius]